MRMHVLGCFGGEALGCRLTSLLIEDRFLLDAGSVTTGLTLQAQAAVDHILITHAHISHIVDLAYLSDNLFMVRPRPIEVWSIPPVIDQIKTHLFNNILWPNFSNLPSTLRPTLTFHTLSEGRPHQLGRYEVTAVRVDHTIEAVGYVISDGASALLYQGDSSLTRELWQVANRTAHLYTIIAEASFPNRLHKHAVMTGHLTPAMLHADLAQLTGQPALYAHHMKPQYVAEILHDLALLSNPPILPLDQGKTYDFGAP